MSGHGHNHAPVDVVRKSTIVAILFALLLGMYQFDVGTSGGVDTVLLAVGFVILASYTIGELAEVVKLPHITGYLLAGLMLGGSIAHTLSGVPSVEPWLFPPFDHGLLDSSVLSHLGPMDTLALALICLTAGGELKLEDLKSGFARIASILAAQTVTIMVGVTALFWAISGPIPFLTFEPIAELGLAPVLALGAVLASVSLATAPAATIAIINSTGAKGPMTGNVLPVVVLKDVVVVLCFSAAVAVATSTLPGAGGGGGLGSTLAIIGMSLVLGAAVGGVIHLYLRYIGAEILLFIIGMVYATAETASLLTAMIDPHGHPELALVFIAAGFTTSNFSSKGDELIHEVERLSLPVYVVFFTMAGAKLHLEDLLTSGFFAALLVAVRILMLVVGVRIGAIVSGSDRMTQRYGWMGFVSQAGLALTLAGTVQATFDGPIGDGLFSLILAGVALNEIIGPVLLQVGLQLAGETAAQRSDGEETEDAQAEPTEEVARIRPVGDPAAWGEPMPTGTHELDELTDNLETDLRQLVRDLELGPLTDIRRDSLAYVRALRLDFLRFHRRIQTQFNAHRDPDQLPSHVRVELADLAGRWRDQLLNRAAQLRRGGWSPQVLQKAIDQRVSTWKDLELCELRDDAVRAKPDDSTWTSVQRRVLAVRRRVSTVQRRVPAKDLVRYHFRGVVPGRLEGLASLLVNHEITLINQTQALFSVIDGATKRLVEHSRTASAEQVSTAIDALRSDVEDDFKHATEEATWIVEDGRARTTQILGGALQNLRRDLIEIDTPDLAIRARRYNRVFTQRDAGKAAISTGLDEARSGAASRAGALALALEVVTLEATVEEAVDEHTGHLARQIRGKGLTQLDRAEDAVRRLRATAEALLTEEDSDTDLTGVELADRLSAAVEPAQRVIEEAVEAGSLLRDWLATKESDEPLLDAILHAAGDLTERYEVPVGAAGRAEWKLPETPAQIEIPFRELGVSFIEANVTRELIEVTRQLALRIDTFVHVLQDLHRILGFNADLAISELEVHGGAIPADTRALVKEMVLDSWKRGALRLSEASHEVQTLPDEAKDEVRTTVLAQLEEFRAQVFEGRIADLRRTLLLRDVQQGDFLARAGGWKRLASDGAAQFQDGLSRTLGDDRITAIRHQLGFKQTTEVPDPEAFAPQVPLERLPTVYRRLFSDGALEAGDLLTGRDDEVQQALAALRAQSGVFRTVALVGLDGIGKRAMANTLLRSMGGGPASRFAPTSQVTVEDVDELLAQNTGGVVLIDGIQHFFRLAPGGFEPLKRLVHGIVLDEGRTAFITLFDTPVWHFANRMSHLDAVFAAQIRMRHLSASEIETALIARHNMSGYALEFEAGTDLAWHVADLLARDEDPHRRRQGAWFRTLHEASGGVMHDALRMWMASIVDVDENDGLLRVGPVHRPPVARIRRLPEDALLTLRQVLSQGSTTPEEHARQFRITQKDAETHLAALAHVGLLTMHNESCQVAEHLRAPIVTVLEGRGWLS